MSVPLPPQSSISLRLYADYWDNIAKPSETRLLQIRMGRSLEPKSRFRFVIYRFNFIGYAPRWLSIISYPTRARRIIVKYIYIYIYFLPSLKTRIAFYMHDTRAPYLMIFLDLTFTNNHRHQWGLNLSGLNYLLTIWSYKWTGLLSAAVLSTFEKYSMLSKFSQVSIIRWHWVTMQNIIVWYLISFLSFPENLFQWPTPKYCRESFKYCWSKRRPL